MSNFRSKKLLSLAKEIPNCTGCGKYNIGDVVSAHANWLEYDKGTGIKAHDWAVAFLCDDCHNFVDKAGIAKGHKRSFWELAHIKTMKWLFENKKVVVNA